MFTPAYLIVVILGAELAILGVLLLPLPSFLAKPATTLLKRTNRYFLWTFISIIVVLLVESAFQTYGLEIKEEPKDHFTKQQHLLLRFRAQRNFYLNLFAFVLIITIFRVRQMVSAVAKLKEDVVLLEKSEQQQVTETKKAQ